MPQRTIRFSETALQQIEQAAKQKGFKSTAAMIWSDTIPWSRLASMSSRD